MMNIETTKATLLLALIVAPLSTGCALSHVGFVPGADNPGLSRSDDSYPADGFQDARKPAVYRIALDCDGDLYPDPREVALDGDRFQACGFTLRNYYRTVLNEPYDGHRVADDLAGKLQTGIGNRPLVVLIHGIGNTYDTARRSYKLARMQVSRHFPGRKFAFLEVYWDGYHGDPAMMWGWAQSSSLRAGLGLRQVLNRLEPTTRIRVLTHSRGAAVIAAALWNVPMDPRSKRVEEYRAAQKALFTPDSLDVRIGMLVPAMGADAFDTYLDRTSIGPAPVRRHQVILGVNEDDPAVGKGALPSWMFGSTELGCNLSLFESSVEPVLNSHAALVDFSASAVHEFKDYLLRRPFEEQFLPLLIDAGPAIATR